MAGQIVARQQGDDYQARWFWLQACSLLNPHSKVKRVVYEDKTLKAFDDVAVYYCDGYTDCTGAEINAHFYQVKFHVTSAGAITGESLCNPSFINASKFSLLQRIKNAHEHCISNQIKYRLIFYSPWVIHPDDILACIHSQANGSIRWDKLSEGGECSKAGKLRKRYKDHLSLTDDDELKEILANLYIKAGPTLDDLSKNLSLRLEAVGLKASPENSLHHIYDELTRKMLAAGINELTAQSLRELCKREGLLMESLNQSSNFISLGIRSFTRWAEDLQHQTQSMVCLSSFFDGRKIRNPKDWNEDILIKISDFIRQNVLPGNAYRLHLDSHSSIAFLAGYLLPEKMGVRVEVIQRSNQGNLIWNFEPDEQTPKDKLWEITKEELHHGATEYALAIGLTHNTRKDAIEYIEKNLPSVGFLILAIPKNGPSPNSVENGNHANRLADELLASLSSQYIGRSQEAHMHIFSSAPNGFMFCLGRKMQLIRNWAMYEYDFDSGVAGAYSQSFINNSRI